eukprot:4817644-Prymnesium_polylepis.3
MHFVPCRTEAVARPHAPPSPAAVPSVVAGCCPRWSTSAEYPWAATAPTRRTSCHHCTASTIRYSPAPHVREVDSPVTVVPQGGVGGCVQLSSHNLRAVLHLKQVVQRVRDRKRRIVPKRVVARLTLWVVARTPQRRAGIVVVVLRPQVGTPRRVRLQAARAIRAHHGRQPPSALQIRIVRRRPLTVARLHGDKAPEGAQVLGWLACPDRQRRDAAGPRQPHVPLATDTRLQRSAHEVAAILWLTEQDHHTRRRRPQLVDLLGDVDRILREVHHSTEHQPRLAARELHRTRTTHRVRVRRVHQRHRRVVEEAHQDVDECRRDKRVRRHHTQKRRVSLAVTEGRA